jgi:hypothetical protein
MNPDAWLETEVEEPDFGLKEYDITSSPNDFNLITLLSFIESGAVKIPGFQRNYVWDIKRASRLIESLLIGLPIPQIFLYEEAKNKYLVIDGQQRLMSIFYFSKKRFPREERRSELRQIFDQNSGIPQAVLEDDKYFARFNLRLADDAAGNKNRLNGLNYDTLGDLRPAFDLRTVRNVIIKQNSPDDGDSSIYEIFNRLNSGGINLTPQEIRISLYHSRFYDLLYHLNLDSRWRAVVGFPEPDLHMKDMEILLRGFAMLIDGNQYKPSMKRFLNTFSKSARQRYGLARDAGALAKLPDGEQAAESKKLEDLGKLEVLFKRFLDSTAGLPPKAFHGSTGRFNISIFDAVFTAVCEGGLKNSSAPLTIVDPTKLEALKADPVFVEATQKATADSANVKSRRERAKAILC